MVSIFDRAGHAYSRLLDERPMVNKLPLGGCEGTSRLVSSSHIVPSNLGPCLFIGLELTVTRLVMSITNGEYSTVRKWNLGLQGLWVCNYAQWIGSLNLQPG